MIRLLPAALLASFPAAAQLVSPLQSATIDSEARNAAAVAQAKADAACAPVAMIPPSEVVGGSSGSGSSCRLVNAAQPRITRVAVVTTAADGTWSVTWSTPLSSAPVTLPIPMNTGAQPIDCQPSTSTATGATGKCFLARTLPSTILTLTALINFDIHTPASGATVQVLAIPMTQ